MNKPLRVVVALRGDSCDAARARLGDAARAERDAYKAMRAAVAQYGTPVHPKAAAAVTAWLEKRQRYAAQQVAEGRAAEALVSSLAEWRRTSQQVSAAEVAQ
jgi:hypothetical protein